jgi:hypothetical protein
MEDFLHHPVSRPFPCPGFERSNVTPLARVIEFVRKNLIRCVASTGKSVRKQDVVRAAASVVRRRPACVRVCTFDVEMPYVNIV